MRWAIQRWEDGFDSSTKGVIQCEERSGRPSVVNDELVRAVDEKVKENRQFTMNALALGFPQVSRTVIYDIVTEKLSFKKL